MVVGSGKRPGWSTRDNSARQATRAEYYIIFQLRSDTFTSPQYHAMHGVVDLVAKSGGEGLLSERMVECEPTDWEGWKLRL